LLDGADVNPREAPQHLHERAVAARIVVGPARAALPPVAATEAEIAARVHKSPDHELTGYKIVGRQGRVGDLAFEAGEDFKRALRMSGAVREKHPGEQR